MIAHSSILQTVSSPLHLDPRASGSNNTAAVLVMIPFEDIWGSSGWYATILSVTEVFRRICSKLNSYFPELYTSGSRDD